MVVGRIYRQGIYPMVQSRSLFHAPKAANNFKEYDQKACPAAQSFAFFMLWSIQAGLFYAPKAANNFKEYDQKACPAAQSLTFFMPNSMQASLRCWA